MPAHLILTVDYEVFGNGTGCLEHCVVRPAERILRVAERFGAPVTFFAEVAEFMAMEEALGSDSVRSVREQLRSAVRSGHDVQLHLHPQWEGATCRADGSWDLQFRRWRIGDLPEPDVEALVVAGRGWIDDVAFGDTPGRSCHAFRAGSWCIQPSDAVVRVLGRNGFQVESTVVPGMLRSGEGEWSDFRSAPELPYWRVEDDVCRPSPSGLWEVPIASGRVGRVRQVLDELQARKTENSRFAPGCRGSYGTDERGPVDRLRSDVRKVLDLGRAKLDFSTMTARSLVAVTNDWVGRLGGNGRSIPVVGIAHTKNWTERSDAQLAEFLSWSGGAGIQSSTYARWVESLGTGAGQ